MSPKGLTSLSVVTTPTFTPGRVSMLFETAAHNSVSAANSNRRLAVAPDGQRFLLLKAAATATGAGQATQSLLFVENWIEELKQRVPTIETTSTFVATTPRNSSIDRWSRADRASARRHPSRRWRYFADLHDSSTLSAYRRLFRLAWIEGRSREHLASVWELDHPCVRDLVRRLRTKALDNHLMALAQRVPVPAISHQPVRRPELEVPQLKLPRLVLPLDINPGMGVRPFEFLDYAGDRDRPIAVACSAANEWCACEAVAPASHARPATMTTHRRFMNALTEGAP